MSIKTVKIICQNLKNILTPSSPGMQDTPILGNILSKFGQNPTNSFGDTKVDRQTDRRTDGQTHFAPITKAQVGVKTPPELKTIQL